MYHLQTILTLAEYIEFLQKLQQVVLQHVVNWEIPQDLKIDQLMIIHSKINSMSLVPVGGCVQMTKMQFNGRY